MVIRKSFSWISGKTLIMAGFGPSESPNPLTSACTSNSDTETKSSTLRAQRKAEGRGGAMSGIDDPLGSAILEGPNAEV